MIYYLMGKSASGKDSIFHKLLERTGWKQLIPYTTRPMREGEIEGQEYHFITKEEFLNYIASGEMAEYRVYDTVFGKWYYGTILPEERRKSGADSAGTKNHEKGTEAKEDLTDTASMLAIGTLESYLQLKKKLGKENIIPIYIEVPTELRLQRALLREEGKGKMTEEEIQRRFKADDEDFSEEKLQEAEIEKRYRNIELSACVEEILGHILQFVTAR